MRTLLARPITWLVLAMLHAAVIALAVVPALTHRMWGVHAWTFLPFPTLLACTVAALAVAALGLAVPRYPSRPAVVAGLALLTAPGFWLLRDTWHLLGDGRLWISVLGGPRAFHAHEPLAFAFTAWAVPAGDPAVVAQRAELWSVALGVISVAFMLLLAGRLGRDTASRWFVFAMLLASGTLQFGFGTIEAYPVLWTVSLAYLWAGVRALQGGSTWPASFLLGLGFGVHGTVALYGASWLVLLARVASWRARLLNAVIAVAPMLVAYVLLPALQGGVAHTDETSKGVKDILEQLSGYPHGLTAYLLAQLNRWTLAAPLALPILLLGISGVRPRRDLLFLVAAGAGMMLFPLLVDTDGSRGASVDWDNFSTAGPALLAAAAGLAATLTLGPAATRTRAVAVVVALFGTFTFVALNADEVRAPERFIALMNAPEWTAQTRGLAAESLGAAYRDRGEYPAAARWYTRAAQEQSGNPRLARNAASLHMRTGNPRAAAELYLPLIPTQGGDPRFWFYLGSALEGAASVDSARTAYEQALRLDPGYREAQAALAALAARFGGSSAP